MKFLIITLFIIFSASADTPVLRLLFQNENLFDSKLASGGSITSVGGGDTADLSQLSAWFYNNGTINTCMVYSESFGVEKRDVEIQIINALSKWKSYFNENKINDFIPESISTNFVFENECRGNEDLVLYFGTGPIFDNLLDVKASQKLNKPIAYVNKTHISDDMTWSKGYIRFIEDSRYHIETRDYPAYPDWSVENSLYQFILHEIGHVLGFEHKPRTIMDENISYDLFISKSFDAPNIDGQEDLFETKRKRKSYLLLDILDSDLFKKIFEGKNPEILLSHKIDGSLEAQLKYEDSISEYYLSTSVINRKEDIPLYTNFQEEREFFLKTESAYFNIRDVVISFSFNGNQTTVLANGVKAAVYKEDF